MAQSRVEKFKDYRKSILSDDVNTIEKQKIDTSLEENSVESKNAPSIQEEALLGEVNFKKKMSYILYFSTLAVIVILAVVFGFILFK